MDSGNERYTRPTATAVAAPTTSVPSPRHAPAVESAGPDITPVGSAPVDTTVDTGPIPAVAPPSRRTLVETDPVGFAPVGAAPTTATAPGGTGTVVTPPVQAPVTHPCRCGHDRDAHEHFRRGTDCAGCDCARFRKPSLLARLRG